MKSGVCPKCGSDDVYSGAYVKWKAGTYGTNSIPIGFSFLLTDLAALDNYVCVNCGYVESYISDDRALQKIARKWPRVDGQKKKRDES